MNFFTLLFFLFVSGRSDVAPAAGLRLALPSQTAVSGATVCLDVTADNFRQIIGLQYSMRWDPDVLTYTGVTAFGLRYLSAENFGAHRTGEGVLTFAWFDQALKGVTLPEGNRLYQVCFRVTGRAGQRTAIEFVDQPTPFEAVNAAEEVMAITPQAGSLLVE